MSTIRRLDSAAADFSQTLNALLAFESATDQRIEQAVAEILADVRQRGDEAVLSCTRRFDGVEAAAMSELELAPSVLQAALASLPAAQREALEAA